jgi:hypothetical protein
MGAGISEAKAHIISSTLRVAGQARYNGASWFAALVGRDPGTSQLKLDPYGIVIEAGDHVMRSEKHSVAVLVVAAASLFAVSSSSFAGHPVLGGIDMYDPINGVKGSQHSTDVTYSNGVVYVAGWGWGSPANTAYAVDVSNPNSLHLLSAGGASGASQSKGVAVANGKLYVANWTSFIQIYTVFANGGFSSNYYHISDDVAPVLPTAAWGIDVNNRRIYTSTCDNSKPSVNWRVYIINAVEPYNVISWIQLGDWHTGHLAARGSYLYYTDGSTFKIADISDENNPFVMKTVNLGQLLSGVVIRDDNAYISGLLSGDPYSMIVYNISNPASPVWVSNYAGGGAASNIYLLGDYALLSGSILHTVNISNPASPTAVTNTDLPEGSDACGPAQITRANSVTGNGMYAYVGASESYPSNACRGDNYERGKLFVVQPLTYDPDNAGPGEWSECSLGEASWDTQYHGDGLPTASSPAWTAEGSESWASTASGALRVNDTGTDSGDKIRWLRNWNATYTRGTTVMARARCASYDLHGQSVSNLGNIFIEDGKYQAQLVILSDRVRVNSTSAAPAEIFLDGTQWHTYRITTYRGQLKVYLDEQATPAITGVLNSTTERARIMFGSGGSSAGPAEQDIYFDYVYAFSNGPYGPPATIRDPAPTISAVVADTKGKGSLSGINPATAAVYWSTDGGATWSQSGGSAWDCQYAADDLPTQATPAWSEPEGNGVTATVASGILHVIDNSTDWGTKVKWARSWGASPAIGTTLLARVKCNATGGDTTVLGNLFVEDGTNREQLKIMTDRIATETGSPYDLDGTQWHTYRITTKNKNFKVYLDENSSPVIDSTMTATASGNRVMFGSGASLGTQDIEFDYVYFTATGDYAPGQNPGSETVIIQCTGQPGDDSGTVTAFDIPFEQDSRTLNKVRFSLRDMAGNTGFSPVYNVAIAGLPTADIDGDNDVDQKDFGLLQVCLGTSTLSSPECEDADLNLDTVVNQDDVTQFVGCMRGPDEPIPAECAYR